MTEVVPLPVWKAGATPGEFFEQLSRMAYAYPERFERVVMVYQHVNAERRLVTRYHIYGPDSRAQIMRTDEAIGLLEIGKMKMYEDTSG